MSTRGRARTRSQEPGARGPAPIRQGAAPRAPCRAPGSGAGPSAARSAAGLPGRAVTRRDATRRPPREACPGARNAPLGKLKFNFQDQVP